MLGPNDRLEVTAIGFEPAGELEIVLDSRRIQGSVQWQPAANALRITLDMPRDLADGAHRVSVRQQSAAGQRQAAFEFRKVYLDAHLGESEHDSDRKGAPEPTFDELEAIERQHDDAEVPLNSSR